jgi:hypothetical protein
MKNVMKTIRKYIQNCLPELLAAAKLLISDARKFAHAIRQRESAKVITEGTMVLDIPTARLDCTVISSVRSQQPNSSPDRAGL